MWALQSARQCATWAAYRCCVERGPQAANAQLRSSGSGAQGCAATTVEDKGSTRSTHPMMMGPQGMGVFLM